MATHTFKLTPEGIVWLTMHPDVEVTRDDARAIVDEAGRLVGARKLPLLVDMRRMRSLDRAAREHFKSDEATRHFTRIALLADSPLSRVLASFFVILGKHRLPVRVFTDPDAACAWLGAAA